MAHKIDMVVDLQYGSTGKGLIAGWLAKRTDYDTVVCSFGTNAGHTYIDESRDLNVMTQQLPTGITSPTVKTVLIGPGALIHGDTLLAELSRYKHLMEGKQLLIHPHACVVEDYHADIEAAGGYTKIGSTAKGVGEAAIERMRRDPLSANVVKYRFRGTDLEEFIATPYEYMAALEDCDRLLIEGAQGYSLSMYHGQYPYVTSRDVTPWQIAADCGLPFKMASYINVVGTLRTHPIRVNNRDGSSGPCYPDQEELDWGDIGEPELTTVTKLPRRIFTFSQQQLTEAMWHCGSYWKTRLFLNFANYVKEPTALAKIIASIEEARNFSLNAPVVEWVGWGPDDKDIIWKGGAHEPRIEE